MYIDQNLQKALSDRIYDKRKPAALQLEQVVRKAVEQGNTELVAGVISELSRDFAYALRHPNYRNGGLIGLAAVAIALGQDNLQAYLDDIIQPILACFGDADSRVRYYACEALYNVAKIAKGEILAYFNEIFDALCKLTADLEESVRNGANLVDQLLRDIVVETASTYVFQIKREPPVIAGPTVEPEGPEGPSIQVPGPAKAAAAPGEPGATPDYARGPDAYPRGSDASARNPDPFSRGSDAYPAPDAYAATPDISRLDLASMSSASARPAFTLDRFIPLLVERIYVMNPATRMFLVQWIMLLDSIPDLELIKYVPGFLEGLVLFLTDSHKEVRVYTRTCLDTLLKDITNVARLRPPSRTSPPPFGDADLALATPAAPTSDRPAGAEAGRYHIGQDTYIYYAEIVDITLSKMDPSHNEIRLVVLDWMQGILSVSPGDVFAKLSSLVGILLPALSDDSPEIRQAGAKLNEDLLDRIPDHAADIDASATIQALSRQLDSENKVLRLSILQWFRVLYSNTPRSASPYEELLAKLLGPLADPSDEVVSQDLDLLALILRDSTDAQLERFTRELVAAFRDNDQLFQNRSRFVVLQLCVLLSPERVFLTFGGIIKYDRPAPTNLDPDTAQKQAHDEGFDRRVIQTMANLLFTAVELSQFRTKLTQLHTDDGARLFRSLFLSWRKNSVAVLALCLLAKAYQPSFLVLQILAKYDVTVHNLIQIDKLVQHIEGPVLAPLRMDLLEPVTNHFLYKTLYGLLMVLPQSPAFNVLQKRLDSVSSIFKLPEPSHARLGSHPVNLPPSETPRAKVEWPKLISEFSKYRQERSN